VVSPSTPRETDGTYWGYTVRIANSLPNVWNECPFEDDGKYDLKIGTTFHGYTHGESIPQMVERYLKRHDDDNNKSQSPFRHCLIVFGGVDGGIEDMVEADESLAISREETHTLFDLWINTCPLPGSKTIRVEEAVWITLAQLRPLLFPPLPLRQDQDIIIQKKESHKNEYKVISKKDDINQRAASSKQQQSMDRNTTFAHDSEISDESST
jgi:predicted SPOUT superfamily RNA methylase MTH1